MTFEDPKLSILFDKLQANRPLDAADASVLYRTNDLHGIAQLANLTRERRHGNRAWRRLDLGDAPVSDTTNTARIATLLALPAGEDYETPLEPHMSGFGYLKHVAVARLLLGGVSHIVARHCPEVENVCQLALGFGADTLIGSNVAELERQILAAGRNLA